jgi:hypothetical protein
MRRVGSALIASGVATIRSALNALVIAMYIRTARRS